jgi:hypothetical protein
MVISKRYKFIFIELPQTATTAIAKELCQNFDCMSLLGKHSTYYEYCKAATKEELEYVTVGTIRNPLDQIVSKFFKYKDDKNYNEAFSKGDIKRKGYGSFLRKLLSTRRNKKRWEYITENNPSFEDYFLKYYTLPYSDWSILHHKQFDYIIRFERLNDDYKRVFRQIGVPVERDLPRTNVTVKKKKDFWSYFESDRAKKRAKLVFGPLMRYWDYEFPGSWDKIKEPWYSKALYNFLNFFRKIYWLYLMPEKKAKLQKSYYDDK